MLTAGQPRQHLGGQRRRVAVVNGDPLALLRKRLRDGAADPPRRAGHQDDVVAQVRDLLAALEAADARATLMRLVEHAARAEWYPALAQCRSLIAYENDILAAA